MKKEHLFPYDWTLKDAVFTKDKGTVFSCFSCGGGSTMGYKLAGFDVIGCNEIDPRMMDVYLANHHPKFAFEESITTFKMREDLPLELFNLDILDGSPPCSSFSMSGSREKGWGKNKKFAEGQVSQVLDTLFFDFIELGKRLQPKVIVAENVKGLLLGNAKEYVGKIYHTFDQAGYIVQHFLLNASEMGVPQRRERVFFIALRKDLAVTFMAAVGLFDPKPKLAMRFNEAPILFSEVDDGELVAFEPLTEVTRELHTNCAPGCPLSTAHTRGSRFNAWKVAKHLICPTVTSGEVMLHYAQPRSLSTAEFCRVGSFPQDYAFNGQKDKYIIGMSVPPVMTAQVASRIYDQWLSKIKSTPKNKPRAFEAINLPNVKKGLF